MFKLSHRLLTLQHLIENEYEHIWDCCCDHGHLGMSLLSKFAKVQSSPTIHFIDIVPTLMDDINAKLTRFYPQPDFHWQVHCGDVSQLPLAKTSKKQLVIIAGVGGELTQEFVTQILKQHQHQSIDFLLCPVNEPYHLRQSLIALDLSLRSEQIINDNKRYYEALLVTNDVQHSTSISAVGEQMWQTVSEQQQAINQAYLAKTIAHYQRVKHKSHDCDIASRYISIKATISL